MGRTLRAAACRWEDGVWTAVLAAVLTASTASGGAALQDADGRTGRDDAGSRAEGVPGARVAWAGEPGGPLEVDGVLDEPAWDGAEAFGGFVQQQPLEGEPATEPTEVRILVDDEAVWVAARMSDSDPDAVVARLARRDEAVHSDWFYLFVDAYHDRRTAFGFGVNAGGVQRDVRYSDDHREDPSWDAVWASAVRRDARGWTAELRIPLSQLRFNTSGDRGWGINVRRTVARTNEVSHWAPVPRGTDAFVSLFGELRGVEDLDPASRVEVVPYTVARLTREPGDPEDPFHRPAAGFGSVGTDLRVGLGPSLTLSATLNPDFGQVEADPAVVNLSDFEVFQQERRPFFVEGADIFQLAFPVWPPFFHSRRIGRRPQGPPPGSAVYRDRPSSTMILGAVKLSGKTDDGWSLGILDAVTAAERSRFVDAEGERGSVPVEPATNHAAVRVARELREGRSGVGVMATAVNRDLRGQRLDFLHSGAYGLALDGFHRFGDDAWEASVGLLGSHVRGDTAAIRRTQTAPGHYFQRPDADHVELDPTRTSLGGYSLHGRIQRLRAPWKWGFFGKWTSPGFEVGDLGFNPELDHARANTWLRYEDYTPGPHLRSWSLGTMAMVQTSTDGRLRELTLDAGFRAQLLNYWSGGVWLMRHRPAWQPTALRGGPALRKPGRWMGSVDLTSDRRAALSGRGHLFWEVEDETDGYVVNADATLTVRPSERIDLSLGPRLSLARRAWQFVGTPPLEGGRRYLVGGLDQRTVSLSTRLDYTFSPRLSLELYARPFLASGRYDVFREVLDPAARRFDERFRTFGPDEVRPDAEADGRLRVGPFNLRDPSFDRVDLQVNSVVRWEYRPGSTLFVVWAHDRGASGSEPGASPLGRDLQRLWGLPGRDVFMVKLSYWMGL